MPDFVDGEELVGELSGVVGFGQAKIGAVLVEFAALFRGKAGGLNDDGQGLKGGLMANPGDELLGGESCQPGVGNDEIGFGKHDLISERAGAEQIVLRGGDVEDAIKSGA